MSCPSCHVAHATNTNYHRVQGPNGTPYQGGVFQLNIRVPDQYPLVPPAVQYHTKIFHPNVHFKVNFCTATTSQRFCPGDCSQAMSLYCGSRLVCL